MPSSPTCFVVISFCFAFYFFFFLTELLFTFLFLPYILCVDRRAIQIGIMSDVCCCFRHLHFTRHGLIIFSYTTHAYTHTSRERETDTDNICVLWFERAYGAHSFLPPDCELCYVMIWYRCVPLIVAIAIYSFSVVDRVNQPIDRLHTHKINQKPKPHRAHRTTKLFDTLNTNTYARTRSTSTLFQAQYSKFGWKFASHCVGTVL